MAEATRWFGAAVLAAFALPLGAEPAAGQTTSARIKEVSAPASVRAGDTVRIAVATDDAAVCEVRLSPAETSTVELRSDALIVWRWRVPRTSGSGTARGEVRCWQARADTGVVVPDAQRTFRVEVAGSDRRAVRFVEPGTLSAGLESEGVDLEDLANLAQAVGALAALLTLGFIARQLAVTRSEARVARTTHLFERYNHRDFMRTWSQILCVIQVKNEADCLDCIRRLEAVPTGNGALHAPELDLPPRTPADEAAHALRRLQRPGEKERVALNDILAFASFFEEASLLYNERTVDRSLMVRSFGGALGQGFAQYWWWISYERRGAVVGARGKESRDHETEDYSDWERAVAAIFNGPSGLTLEELDDDRPQGSQAEVRALCLPAAQGSQASPDEWRQCQRLSCAVGDLLRHEEGCERLERLIRGRIDISSQPGPARCKPKARTLCLPPWSEAMPRPSRWRRAVCRLGAWLDARGNKGLRAFGLSLTRADPRIGVREKYQHLGALLDACRRKAGPSGVERLIAEIEAEAKR